MPYQDRKSTRLNSSHGSISYAVFCLKKKKNKPKTTSQASATTVAGHGVSSTSLLTSLCLTSHCSIGCVRLSLCSFFFFFFFNDTATTEIYTLSLHDALPI